LMQDWKRHGLPAWGRAKDQTSPPHMAHTHALYLAVLGARSTSSGSTPARVVKASRMQQQSKQVAWLARLDLASDHTVHGALKPANSSIYACMTTIHPFTHLEICRPSARHVTYDRRNTRCSPLPCPASPVAAPRRAFARPSRHRGGAPSHNRAAGLASTPLCPLAPSPLTPPGWIPAAPGIGCSCSPTAWQALGISREAEEGPGRPRAAMSLALPEPRPQGDPNFTMFV
jgi:hypothetical protein